MTNLKQNIKTHDHLKKKKLNNPLGSDLFIKTLLIKNKKKNSGGGTRVFIMPKKSPLWTLLRPPYRHKLSRMQLSIKHYKLILSEKKVIRNRPAEKNITIDSLIAPLKFVESSFWSIYKIQITVAVTNPDNFILKKYQI